MKKFTCESCKSKLYAREVPIFSSLEKNEMNKIATNMAHLTFNKGDILCTEGEESSKLFILSSGSVKLSKLTNEGKEQIVHILNEGEFFGESNLFDNRAISNFTATILEKTNVCIMSKDSFEEVLSKNPNIAFKIINQLSKRLVETENIALNLATNDVHSRIANMLLDFSEKYGVKSNEGIIVRMPISREGMGNYCGITRETISRKLPMFEDIGAIKLKGNKTIIIRNLNQLKEFIY
ncbi:Crp/Fnr family transcriptional regulator [Paraclostridium bifermentans]|uniref:Crp/Fnr family transcriptional regulator n=1 Tax=Paraclostridium bifermentans TaxID=1490 RepID=UPI0029140590|nr:Crp/Fnr family transcriptional regulator [Paraclostridium bifermentans]MDU3336919.1 Crp/Fnr family transcriptional regulator [Paraclostridium bifermentans]